MANATEPRPKKQKFTRQMPSSRMGQWLQHGREDDSRLAFVMNVAANGAADLLVLEQGMPYMQVKSGIRHKDDPIFDEHPDRLREYGCWDYMPQEQPRPEATVDDLVDALLDRCGGIEGLLSRMKAKASTNKE